MKEGLSRRQFIHSGLAASTAMAFSANSASKVLGLGDLRLFRNRNDVCKGFIVSDAHFGWRGDAQPTVAQQKEMMRRILEKFPDLDVVIDSGDAHHNYAEDVDRGNWTEVIAGGCGTLPFFYVMGNHEAAFSYDWDPEWRANILGSLECRLYYSWDIKGIHFISLPQMFHMSYLSEEAMDWVRMDMELNKNKTTVVVSHNSIKGTTEYFADKGYRQTTNSDVIIELFKKYPNVAAWMHGHNHTYEVVPKEGTIYTSNGRIGGFMPGIERYGEGHLGGIYFEAAKDHFTVRCFSATANKFFDEMEGFDHLSHTLNKRTSVDGRALPSISYGYGGARDGQIIPVYHHHSGASKREVFIGGAKDQIINENSDFSVFTQRTGAGWRTKHLAGFNVDPALEDEDRAAQSYEWLDPGVKLRPLEDPDRNLTLYSPGAAWGQRSYYRVKPGEKYKVKISIDAGKGGQNLHFMCNINDKNMQRHHTLTSDRWELSPGEHVFEHIFDVPSSQRESIYTDKDSDNEIQMVMGARFRNMVEPVIVKKFEVSFADYNAYTVDPAVAVDDTEVGKKGTLRYGQLHSAEIPVGGSARYACKIKAGGNRKLTFIVRDTAAKWQVRNAAAGQSGDALVIGPMRNKFSDKNEIVIAPMIRTDDAFVHRLRNIARAVVEPAGRRRKTLKIEIKAKTGDPQIDIVTAKKPEKVEGADDWRFDDSILTISKVRDDKIKVWL